MKIEVDIEVGVDIEVEVIPHKYLEKEVLLLLKRIKLILQEDYKEI